MILLCYKETQELGMYRQSETRAGKHRRHTHTRNASLPTQANHTARGARKQPPNQGAIHVDDLGFRAFLSSIRGVCPIFLPSCKGGCLR